MFETNNGSNKIGLGGWLSVWFVLNCLSLLRFVVHIDFRILTDDAATVLTNPDSQYYHPLWRPLLIYEFILQFLNPIVLICAIILYARKSRLFPKVIIAFYASNFVLVLIDIIPTLIIGKSVNLPVAFPWRDIAGCLFAVCVWIPYFLKSKRVKETFVK
jgi:hypothetical protein